MTEEIVIENCLQLFFHRFQTNPFNYLYESDLQAELYTRLSAEIKRTVHLVGKKISSVRNKDLITGVIKSEYPTKVRFDLAVIADQINLDQDGLSDKNLKNEPLWVLPVKCAIEIKYCQLGENAEDKLSAVFVDVAKIEKYVNEKKPVYDFSGYCLYFVQDEPENFDRWINKDTKLIPEFIKARIITPNNLYDLQNQEQL